MLSERKAALTGIDTGGKEGTSQTPDDTKSIVGLSRHIFDRKRGNFVREDLPASWKPPLSPFTKEGFASLFAPDSEENARLLEEQIDMMIVEAQEGTSPFWQKRMKHYNVMNKLETEGSSTRALKPGKVRASKAAERERNSIVRKLLWHKTNLAIKATKYEVQRERMRRFILWVVGAPEGEQLQRIRENNLCISGNLDSIEVREYLYSFIDAIGDYLKRMTNLLLTGPGSSLNDHQLYYHLFIETDVLSNPVPFLSNFKEYFYQGLDLANWGQLATTHKDRTHVIHPYIRPNHTAYRKGMKTGVDRERMLNNRGYLLRLMERHGDGTTNIGRVSGTMRHILSSMYETIVQSNRYYLPGAYEDTKESIGVAEIGAIRKFLNDTKTAADKKQLSHYLDSCVDYLDKFDDIIKSGGKRKKLTHLTNRINFKGTMPRTTVDDVSHSDGKSKLTSIVSTVASDVKKTTDDVSSVVINTLSTSSTSSTGTGGVITPTRKLVASYQVPSTDKTTIPEQKEKEKETDEDTANAGFIELSDTSDDGSGESDYEEPDQSLGAMLDAVTDTGNSGDDNTTNTTTVTNGT